MNPFVFIVGCLRSGTTLLRRMVDAHPHLAIIHETEWVPRWFEKGIGITPDGLVTPELIDRLLEFRKFADLRIGREELESLLEGGEPLSYSSFVSGIFDLYGKAQGKRLVGEKSPGYVRYLRTLHHLWPEAKFVHLIRDGRDVCLSVMNWKKAGRTAGRYAPWAEDPISTAALWWEWHVRLGREAGASLGPVLYHEIRYESLLAQPEDECRALCAFLGIPYDGAMLRYHEGRTRHEPGLDAKAAWLPITSGLRDWRSEIPAEDLERFEAIVGDLLSELGYPRAFPHPREEAMRHASRIRESFRQDPRARRLLGGLKVTSDD
jgi:Sulfotransferase family